MNTSAEPNLQSNFRNNKNRDQTTIEVNIGNLNQEPKKEPRISDSKENIETKKITPAPRAASSNPINIVQGLQSRKDAGNLTVREQLNGSTAKQSAQAIARNMI